MAENADKIADKLGIHAQNSQVNVENMFVGQATKPRNSQERLVAWQQICRAMLIDREQLTSNRLMSSPDTHKDLNIFVDLALVEQTKADKRDGDVLPEQGSELYKPSRYSESERFEFNRFLKDVLSVQKNEKLTIFGEPGSGKTTLLQKVAFWLLDNTEDLVIWVSLGELKDKSLRDYLTEEWLPDAVMYSNPEILEDWERQFLQRRVWLLLDGLDEMTPETRDALSLKGWISQARVVVSCRINVWQTNPRIIYGFKSYRMLEFRLPQIKEFTQKWFSHDRAAGRYLYEALNQPGKERIRDLVRNPLRLTLLCSTWHLREGMLPTTRAELYEQFVDDLYEWKKKQFPTTGQQREDLNHKLGKLAKEAIDKELTKFRLRHKLVCKILGNPNDIASALRLALDLGWLNTIGVNPDNPREPVYAFFHATFQEYFATRSIDTWDFFVPQEHQDMPVEDLALGELKRYRIFEPQWKEVILLWLGKENIKSEDKYDFIKVLLDFDDGCDGFYSKRAFFLAALGILEIPDYPDSTEVIQQVVQWGFGSFDSEDGKWLTYLEPIERQARITLLSTTHHLVVSALSIPLKIAKNKSVLYEAANLLSNIDSSNREAIGILVSLLDSTNDDGLKLQVARSLAQTTNNQLEAQTVLIELAKFSQNEWVRRGAALSLLTTNPHHKAGIDTIIDILRTSEDESIIWNLNLENIGTGNLRLVSSLIRLSYSGRTSEVRSASIGYLTKILASNEKAIESLLGVVKFSKFISDIMVFSGNIPNKGVNCLRYIAELSDQSREHKDRKKGVVQKPLI